MWSEQGSNILMLNDIKNPDVINPGQELLLDISVQSNNPQLSIPADIGIELDNGEEQN